MKKDEEAIPPAVLRQVFAGWLMNQLMQDAVNVIGSAPETIERYAISRANMSVIAADALVNRLAQP